MSELETIAECLKSATNYAQIFGAADGDVTTQEQHVKNVYRKLARIVHPDLHTAVPEKKIAEEAFMRLSEFMEAAKHDMTEGRYGEQPELVVRTKKFEHRVASLVKHGDICDLYAATTISGSSSSPSLLKLARNPADTDLMQAEARSLKTLLSPDGDAVFFPFLPKLIDSFVYTDGPKRRQANVIERLDGWYSLQEVKKVYPDGLSPLHMVWVWRRLLWILGYVHEHGLIHGAVWPGHIIIHPIEHGLKLVDWCYSTSRPDETMAFMPIKAVVPVYKDWYPPEVPAQENPTFGTDIFMAVRSMIYLMGGDGSTGNLTNNNPKAIRAFMNGCSQINPRLRPQAAWLLLQEFDELLERLGPPFWPRKYRTFTMPAS